MFCFTTQCNQNKTFEKPCARRRTIEENIIRKDNLLIMKGCGHSIKNVPARSGGFQSIIPDEVLHLCAKGHRARRLSFSKRWP